MKKLIVSSIAIALIGLAACEPDQILPQKQQNGSPNQATILANLPLESLSADETAGIRWMREEERLARDVYDALYLQYGRQVFDNISNSEQSHMDAVLTLIERYELEDPGADLQTGEFAFDDLQSLYDELIAEGDVSLIAALQVGALIEEVDIVDLQKQLEEVVDNQDVTAVYDHLLRGSRNHLRAFVNNLTQQGVTYEPQVLDSAAYHTIVSSGMESGH